MKIGVLGSGSWGTALTKIITDNGHEVCWCVRSEKTAEHIRKRHHNPKYLSSVYFAPDHLMVTSDPAQVYAGSDVVLLAVPSAYVMQYIDANLNRDWRELTLVSAVKGMIPGENLLLNQLLEKKIQPSSFILCNHYGSLSCRGSGRGEIILPHFCRI